MDYSALYHLDIAVAILVAAAAGTALHGALTGHPVTGRIRLFLAVALALVALRLVAGLLLARYGWEFASRQLTYQLPLVAIPVAGALLVAMRSPLGVRARAGTAVVMATAAAAGAAFLAVIDGVLLPSPATAGWLTALAILGPPLGWLAISGTGISPAARPVVRTVAVAVPVLALAEPGSARRGGTAGCRGDTTSLTMQSRIPVANRTASMAAASTPGRHR